MLLFILLAVVLFNVLAVITLIFRLDRQEKIIDAMRGELWKFKRRYYLKTYGNNWK